ncbi:glycosyltransferase family 1 protein [Mucilaginibacter limnophilus]|uniref:Glycosyltransferase family 1 protein n=1 Tax=Mucilaginibacter limnophilus TaxID=1932778 RepID=A0A3S2UNE8_9SPHI|nr:glycosyltransferase family 1 protein [Mucilaginibacter limnophilus]RVU02017.1 glycosyltransferase family 1 protein [Mucilaginibacter limnophilus]
MKRILFDNQIFCKQPYGGISKYFAEIITGISAHEGFSALPRKFYSANDNLTASKLTRLGNLHRSPNFPGKKGVEKIIVKQERLATLDTLQKGRFDVFHPTYYDPYFVTALPAKKPLVLTVHDMIHENYYDHHYEYLLDETLWKRKLIPRADHIIAVSAYTKTQILKYFPKIDEQKISVIHHGINQASVTFKQNINLPERYLLYVGIRKHYKNFIWLIKSLASYLKDNKLTLLCAGAAGFDAYEKDVFSQLGITDHVQHLPIAYESELAAAYANALCLVFPSLEEGFGIPILEAFNAKCPVILPNSSCFPEIAADAALYFRQGDSEDIIATLEAIISRNDFRTVLIKKGAERVTRFTWQASVEQHLEVYKQLVG